MHFHAPNIVPHLTQPHETSANLVSCSILLHKLLDFDLYYIIFQAQIFEKQQTYANAYQNATRIKEKEDLRRSWFEN